MVHEKYLEINEYLEINIWRLIQYGLFPQTECWYIQFILLAFFSLVFNQEIEWVAYGKKWSVLHVLFWDITSVQSLSHVWLFVTPWTTAYQASLSITNSRSLLKLKSIELMMLSNHLIFCHPLLLPSILPSIRVFSNESVLRVRWPKYWSLRSTAVLPMNIQEWFPLGLTGWIFLQSRGLSRVFSNTTVQKHQFFHAQLSL